MRIYLIRYISLKKIINILKVYLGYSLSILFKKVIVSGYPYSLSTEPTNYCNLHCVECPSGNKTLKREKGYLKIDLYRKIIDDIKDYIVFQMIYFQGEPFLHPQLFDMIKYADEQKIYTCTSTNGHFLSEENCIRIIQSGLKKIIISIDGTTQESYEKYRVGGRLETVITGIKNLQKSRQKLKSRYPTIHLQFIVFKHNQHQLKEIRQMAASLGVNKLELKSAQINDFKQNQSLIPDIPKYARYKTKKDETAIKNKLLNRCFRIWSTMVVSWDGTIVPCCFDKDLDYKSGNVTQAKATQIWTSKDFTSFRKSILFNRKNIAICRNCTEGLRTKS